MNSFENCSKMVWKREEAPMMAKISSSQQEKWVHPPLQLQLLSCSMVTAHQKRRLGTKLHDKDQQQRYGINCKEIENVLLYLPTQIHFVIGGECVTCRGSKLAKFLGKQQLELLTRRWSCHMSWVKTHQLPRQTTTGTFDSQVIMSHVMGKNSTNFLGKQQLELLTCMWSGPAPWNAANLYASQGQTDNIFAVCSVF